MFEILDLHADKSIMSILHMGGYTSISTRESFEKREYGIDEGGRCIIVRVRIKRHKT